MITLGFIALYIVFIYPKQGIYGDHNLFLLVFEFPFYIIFFYQDRDWILFNDGDKIIVKLRRKVSLLGYKEFILEKQDLKLYQFTFTDHLEYNVSPIVSNFKYNEEIDFKWLYFVIKDTNDYLYLSFYRKLINKKS